MRQQLQAINREFLETAPIDADAARPLNPNDLRLPMVILLRSLVACKGPQGRLRSASTGGPQVAGMIVVAIGTAIALWCVFTFVFIGKGTPAPFDPPRKLVIRGPYRFVRNPMYIGAGMTLAGAVLYYQSSTTSPLLPVAIDLDLYRPVLSHNSPVRCVVRGADVATNFRRRIRSVLPTRQPLPADEK